MSNSVIQEIITRLETEYNKAHSVESRSILAYLTGLLKNNYIIRERNLLEKFYIKGIMHSIDSLENDTILKSFDDLYNQENLT